MQRSLLAGVLAACLTGCAGYLAPPAASFSAVVPVAVVGAEAAPSRQASRRPEIIEAGCGFTGAQLAGEVASMFEVACPANCMSEARLVAGTDVYLDASSICAAGIHAGAIPFEGGNVIVRIEPGRKAYRGSTRHGVTSADYGSAARSISLVARHGSPGSL